MTITTHRTFMGTDMSEQPMVLRRLLDARATVHGTVRRVMPRPLIGVALVGRGSSGNAALYGRSVIELRAGIPVTLVAPSAARLYAPNSDAHGLLAIGLTQSGRTGEIIESLASMRARGAATLGITAHPSSPVAEVCDEVLDLCTGRERAVPATKTFLAELALLAMIAEAVADRSWPTPAWRQAVGGVEVVLADEDPAQAAAAIVDAPQVSVIASGLLLGLAEEAALKIIEAARIPAGAWSSKAFLHGPMTLAGPAHPVVAIGVHGPTEMDLQETMAHLRRVPIVAISDRPDADLPFNGGLPEPLAAIPATVRAQQLALELARRRGVDPDRPPRLRKVAPV